MLEIRRATAADAVQLLQLIIAIAEHHDQARSVRTNADELLRAGFGDHSKFGALLAELDGQVVGYASYTIDYSIWLGHDYMRIDDVYVDADARGNGIGEALMEKCRELCLDIGVPRIKWEVQTDNVAARRFYEHIGATTAGVETTETHGGAIVESCRYVWSTPAALAGR